GSILMSKGEFAYSDQNLDLLSSEGTKEVGKAFKLETISIFGPLSLGTRFKRVGPAFQSIGDANPKQDVWESGGSLSYSPSDLFFTETIYSNEKFSQSGVAYANTRLNSKAKLTPANFPSLAYFFNEDSESNDPVSGSVIDRLTVRNAVETRYRYLFLDSNLRGSIERRLNREPSAEATIYRILSFGTSTFGLEKIMASGNIELKNTELPDGSAPFTRTVNLAVSAAPSKEYFTSASITQIDDTEQGSTNVTELAFKAEPQPEIRTDGKYTISAVQEDFSGTEESVSRQVGSLKLDYRPMKEIRIGYIFKPDFTMLARSGILTYNNGTNQTELLWSPAKEVSTGLTYRINNLMLIDKSDPMFSRRDETRDTNSLIYSIKYAPFRFLSTEFDYSLENFISKDLTTAEPVSYLDTKGKTDRYDAIIRTPLSERLSIDSRYSYEKITEGTGEAISNSIDTLTQTASLKTTWNISDSWSLIASGSYSTETDNLASGSKETYTVSPGFGFICRLGDTLRVDAEYTYSRSYSGEATEMSIYSLEAKYNLSQIVHITFRGEQELSIEPNYKTTDILTNIEINL
ncbi:MAG: hypothetical protein NT030_05530, partial [Candidatus Saganbacteria bacterium]|nr:hypothetical protein [Candidatus Saganbacteria bacterium]